MGHRSVTLASSAEAAAAAASLHCSEIATGFLAGLGEGFLCRLYRRIAWHPASFLLVAYSPERALPRPPQGALARSPEGTLPPRPGGDATDVSGFLAASVDVAALYRSFALRDGPAVLAADWPRLARSLPRVLETLRYGRMPGGKGPGAPGAGGSREAELLAMAVRRERRGQGVGRALVEGFLAELDRREVPDARVVVGASRMAARHLYAGAGFRDAGRVEVHRGEPSVLMRRP